MGKKKPEIMQKFSAQFIDGAEQNGCPRDVAQEVWDNIVKFGGYGFNKSHSAAYALITYQTAYLKANHRVEFIAGNMSCEMGDSDKVKEFIDDCKRSRIGILPPDIRYSGWEFEPEETVDESGEAGFHSIRFGFGAVKGTGRKAIDALLVARDELLAEGEEIDLHSLASRVDPSEVARTTWEAVIKAGSFDFTGHNRGAVLRALDRALADAQAAAADRKAGQSSFFDAFGEGESEAPDATETALSGIDDRDAFDTAETLAVEHEVLGYYLTGHPLEERAGLVALLSSNRTDQLAGIGEGEVRIAGLVTGFAELLVKSGRMAGRKMARFRLEDLNGRVGVTVFPRTYEECKELLEDGAVVLVRGKLEQGTDEPAVLLDEVYDLRTALQHFRGGLLVNVNPADGAQLEGLRETVRQHGGDRPLFLQVEGTDGRLRRVRAGKQLGVTISEDLATQLCELLGTDRVGLVRV